MDDYEFHYPQELNRDNLAVVQEALDGHGIYAVATGTHLNPRFGKGGLTSPDDTIRGEALAEALDTATFAGELGSQMILWPGIEGYNYPVPDAVRGVVGAVHRWRRPGRDPVCRGRYHALPGAQELRAGDEDLHAQRRDDVARDPQATHQPVALSCPL